MRTRRITDFLNSEVKEYAIDILENRCIPSMIDSFKPSQRKVIYVADRIWRNGNDKPMKVFQLTGKVAADAYYHHGNQSMDTLITTMSQSFKNNLPVLDGVGQLGTLRSPSAGAPRYIGTRLHPNFRLVYKDFELLENRVEDGVTVEPLYYLPIIPTILTNSSMGIGMAYSSNILGRNPKEIVQVCIDVLNGKKVKELKPWLNEFSGTWTRDTSNPNKWFSKGIYEIVKNDVHVTDLPPKWTFEAYENYLDSLVEKKIIRDYDNNSSSGVDYTLKFRKETLQELTDNGKLEDVLKINDSVTENLTTLDENGKLKIFDRAEDILTYFVDFRLGYYRKRKDYLIGKYDRELKDLCFRAKFIKSIIDRKLVVNNVPKDEIVKWLDENRFDRIDGGYGYLLNMPIYSLTKERYDEIIQKAKEKKSQLDEISGRNPKDMYLEDLSELKRKLK